MYGLWTDADGPWVGGWSLAPLLPLRVDKREHAGGEGSKEATMSSLGDDVAPGGRREGEEARPGGRGGRARW